MDPIAVILGVRQIGLGVGNIHFAPQTLVFKGLEHGCAMAFGKEIIALGKHHQATRLDNAAELPQDAICIGGISQHADALQTGKLVGLVRQR